MTTYQILYWKDMPAQVRIYEATGRKKSYKLPDSFQQAIDARAMQEGLIGTDAYLEHWHWGEKQESDLTPEEIIRGAGCQAC